MKNIVETLLKHSGEKVAYGKATCGQKVMPPNLIVKPAEGGDSLCLGSHQQRGDVLCGEDAEYQRGHDGRGRAEAGDRAPGPPLQGRSGTRAVSTSKPSRRWATSTCTPGRTKSRP